MVRIVTDTGTAISPAEGKALGIEVIPAVLILDGKEYADLADITPAEFLPILQSGKLATSSQPSPALILEIFEQASAENPVLYVAIGEGLSGAYTTACGIRESLPNKEHITVYDTATIVGTQRVMALKAKRLAAQGKSMAEITRALDASRDNNKSYLIPKDLFHLQRGGRLTPTAAKVVNLLGLLPVITQSKDRKKLDKASLCRGYPKAVEKAIDSFRRIGVGKGWNITISQGDNMRDAILAKVMLEKHFPDCTYEIRELACALLNQGGCGCIVIQATLDE